jgi:hypothetical protein
MKPRVLFADDQIPWPGDSESKNALVMKEIIKYKGDKLRKKGKDPETAFNEDRLWFERLHATLSTDFQVIPARTFTEAETHLREPSSFDLAVIDLSWTGDAERGAKPRENIGFDLLDTLAEHNKTAKRYIPVIALSQNFTDDSKLLASALKRGALPIPKDYTRTDDDNYPGHQALAAAIEYLFILQPRDNHGGIAFDDKTGRTVPDLVIAVLRRTGVWSLLILVCLLFGVVLFLAHINTKPGEPVKLFDHNLYTRGVK